MLDSVFDQIWPSCDQIHKMGHAREVTFYALRPLNVLNTNVLIIWLFNDNVSTKFHERLFQRAIGKKTESQQGY